MKNEKSHIGIEINLGKFWSKQSVDFNFIDAKNQKGE